MPNTHERNFSKGQFVYLIDTWGSHKGMTAFVTRAEIVSVNEEERSFVAVLYGDTYQRYSFHDYGRLIFYTTDGATKALNKIPEPQTVVYQIINNRIFKKYITGIYNQYIDGFTDLVMYLNKGKAVSIKEIGISIFLNESDAREHKNNNSIK